MPNLEAARRARAEKLARGEKIRQLTPRERLERNPNSKKYAIEAKFWDCQGGEHADSGWQWAIGNCEVLRCPLHGFRPYQAKG